jgi:hypothetical protein
MWVMACWRGREVFEEEAYVAASLVDEDAAEGAFN